MSLRSKIVLILAFIMASYVAADFGIQKATVARSFAALEAAEGARNVDRVVEAIAREAADLHQANLHWSSWDAMCAFVEDPDPAFAASAFDPARLRNDKLDLFLVCDTSGKVLHHHLTDPDTQRPASLREFPRERLHPKHPFLVPRTGNDLPHGLLLTEWKPMLASARPILPSDGKGDARGVVILGRFLSSELVERLTRQTRVPFQFWQMDGREELPPEVQALRDELISSPRPVLDSKDAGLLHAYRTVGDYRGRPDFLVRANVPRDISAAGSASVRYAVLSTLAAALILLFVLMQLLHRTVLTPLSTLTRHAVQIGRTEDFRAKLRMDRTDEIGDLSREFDHMMDKLETARTALVDAARTAGKSEIATGILHNVGNVLNSVNVSTNLLAEKVGSMRVSDLETLSKILADNAARLSEFLERDPRGKHVQPAIAAIAQHLGSQKSGILAELSALTEGIESIRELVKSQQSFAVQSVLREPVSIARIVERAVAITNEASSKDARLEIEYRFADLPDVLVDKHRLLEILVNLVQNARQSMDMAGGGPKRLVLETSETAEGRVRIRVTDTGVGIPKENLVKVFNLGFTTKPEGHGFGLHTAANAATEMGGTLTAHSDGPGRGATFTVEFPKAPVTAPEPVGSAS